VTEQNRIGASVSWRDLRRWATQGAKLWLPSYIRDAERHEGTALLGLPLCPFPQTWRWTAEDTPTKWPEETIPAVIFQAPGLGEAPARQADRSFMSTWVLAITAVVRGSGQQVDEDGSTDVDVLASVYGNAIVQMMLEAAGRFTTTTGYAGPLLDMEALVWEDFEAGVIDASRTRTLAAVTATFSVVFRRTASTMGGPDQPPVDPATDPGPWPEVLTTVLDLEREALG
jgi:hypothetical protein